MQIDDLLAGTFLNHIPQVPTKLSKSVLVYDSLCSVTVKVHDIAALLAHDIWRNLILCFWTMATYIWLWNKLVYPLR